MQTVKEQIDAMRTELHLKQYAVRAYEAELRKLEDSRVHCPHVWGLPIKGYEHEGANCIHCGINALYAATLASRANQK